MLHTLLKNTTMSSHHEIEKNPMLKKILSKSLSREDYSDILNRFLGFIEPFEAKVRQILKSDMNSHLLKTQWLKKDLKSLNSEMDIKLNSFSNSISTVADALGALYVLEGSMLGGQMILRHLKKFDFITEENSNYYSGYKENTAENWKSFLNTLEKFDNEHPKQREGVVNSAIKTFEELDRWFRS